MVRWGLAIIQFYVISISVNNFHCFMNNSISYTLLKSQNKLFGQFRSCWNSQLPFPCEDPQGITYKHISQWWIPCQDPQGIAPKHFSQWWRSLCETTQMSVIHKIAGSPSSWLWAVVFLQLIWDYRCVSLWWWLDNKMHHSHPQSVYNSVTSDSNYSVSVTVIHFPMIFIISNRNYAMGDSFTFFLSPW